MRYGGILNNHFIANLLLIYDNNLVAYFLCHPVVYRYMFLFVVHALYVELRIVKKVVDLWVALVTNYIIILQRSNTEVWLI